MKKLALLVSILVVFTCGTSAWGSLTSGSLSTPLLYDSSSYPVQPYSARIPVANAPGGLSATAAWAQYGELLKWNVTNNGNGTYNYQYYFGPGWNPPTQPTSGSLDDPYIANKNMIVWDIQLGSDITNVAQLSNVSWNVYQFDGQKIGSGTATHWDSYIDPDSGNVVNSVADSGDATMLSVANFQGKTGHKSVGYKTQDLFHGLQWVMPKANNSDVWNTNASFDLAFTSTYAPGWGNFFANSSQTKANQDFSEVVAFDGTFDASGKLIATWSNAVAAAGAPVPIPPSVLLFGSGLSGLFFFRRKKIEC